MSKVKRKIRPNGGKVHIPQAMIAEALKENGGIVSKVCDKFGISYQAIYVRLKRSPKLKKIQEEAGIIAWEIAQANVLDLLKSKDPKTSRWYMDHSPEGKKRGWGKGLEVTGPDGKPLIPENKPREILPGMTLEEATRIYMENLKHG